MDSALATHVFHRSLLEGDRAALRALLTELRQLEPPEALVERALVPAMARLGDEWARGLVGPEVVAVAAGTAEFVADLLAPRPSQPDPGAPVVAVGSLGDAHSLGKRLVVAHLASAGVRAVDLGGSLTPEEAVAGARGVGAAALLLSATMLRSAIGVAEVVALVRRDGRPLPVGVGGAPFRLDPSLWQAVGAGGAATAAHEAPALVERLLATAR